jgi:putative serine/threonine protein kinase
MLPHPKPFPAICLSVKDEAQINNRGPYRQRVIMTSPPVRLRTEELDREPYASIICYPRAESEEVKRRISELKQLGVTEAEFIDTGYAGGLPVIGKGFVGVVITAFVGENRYALKMRRIDAGKVNFFHESEMLKKANSVGIGPKFVSASENFLVSQFLPGGTLGTWMKNNKNTNKYRIVLKDVLEQCRRLDSAGIDHGEISKAHKHILMDENGRPFIIDFETARTERKATNVSAICQFLFLSNSDVSKLITEVMGERNKREITNAVQEYKREQSEDNFAALLRACF